jgi:hypothetical protein
MMKSSDYKDNRAYIQIFEKGYFDDTTEAATAIFCMSETIADLEARLVEAKRIIAALTDYNSAPDDASWDSPHPIVEICSERDAALAQLAEAKALMNEAVDDFHGEVVLFSTRFLTMAGHGK